MLYDYMHLYLYIHISLTSYTYFAYIFKIQKKGCKQSLTTKKHVFLKPTFFWGGLSKTTLSGLVLQHPVSAQSTWDLGFSPRVPRVVSPCGFPVRFFPGGKQQRRAGEEVPSREPNISHFGKRNIIFKCALGWDMLIPRRVNPVLAKSWCFQKSCLFQNHDLCFKFPGGKVKNPRSAPKRSSTDLPRYIFHVVLHLVWGCGYTPENKQVEPKKSSSLRRRII